MPQPRPWLDEIVDALRELGGEGTLEDIYTRIFDRGIMDFASNPFWKDRVRGTIYQYSSDCDVYNGKRDIFYSVSGKGKGQWGLRDFEPSENNVNLTEDDEVFAEGKKKLRQHIYRERNPRLIRIAKERFKANHGGRLYCEVCGFDFYRVYGEIGQDYIEGHHTIPISELKDGDVTKVEDIALVCSNCHRMLHRKRPWLTKAQLQSLMNEVRR
ncbi:HNH endonuclease [Brevibacillus humidisoli]|uniref:HNH endonuclease n=1 Tax=Brevibacillus humidisoli TaxID=2895522 RepID=UPI001E500A68|nr:HNH endonuclease [Brevibacillus humidisoli]UFJ41243.1 HNH endonuclease [Brevibacillus humidisoli]